MDQCGKVSVRWISAARSVLGGSVRQGRCPVDQCGKVSVGPEGLYGRGEELGHWGGGGGGLIPVCAAPGCGQ